MKILIWLLKVGPLAQYRRIVGVVSLAAAFLITALQEPNLLGLCVDSSLALCGWLKAATPFLGVAGAYVGLVGSAFKDDVPQKWKDLIAAYQK